jgi:hypothetical protein
LQGIVGILGPRVRVHVFSDFALVYRALRPMARVIGLFARELADAINERSLYEKRDGSPVDPS